MKSVIVFGPATFEDRLNLEKLRKHLGLKYVIHSIFVNQLGDEEIKIVMQNHLILTNQIPMQRLLRIFDIWQFDKIPKFELEPIRKDL